MSGPKKILLGITSALSNAYYRTKVEENPIFLLGNQKAGTTAIAALLGRSTGLSVMLDTRTMYEPNQTLIHRGSLQLKDLTDIRPRDFNNKIWKEPSFTLLFNHIIKYYPESKFGFIVRNPFSNIKSILDRLRIDGKTKTLEKHQLEALSPEWKLVLDGKWLGLDGPGPIEFLAQRWNCCAEIYLQNADRMELIRYEDFINEKVATIEAFADRLGLPTRNEISHCVDQQYQPKGSNESPFEFFGRTNHDKIFRICRDTMRNFGY